MDRVRGDRSPETVPDIADNAFEAFHPQQLLAGLPGSTSGWYKLKTPPGGPPISVFERDAQGLARSFMKLPAVPC